MCIASQGVVTKKGTNLQKGTEILTEITQA